MNSSDKVIISVVIVCAVAGLVQTTIQQRDGKDMITETVVATNAAPEKKISSEGYADYETKQVVDYEHNIQINTGVNQSRSLLQQRKLSVRQKRSRTGRQQYDQRNIDYFAAREGMKDILLQESYEGSLTQTEKWELIESGALPW
jgi:hypothetical protein